MHGICLWKPGATYAQVVDIPEQTICMTDVVYYLESHVKYHI